MISLSQVNSLEKYPAFIYLFIFLKAFIFLCFSDSAPVALWSHLEDLEAVDVQHTHDLVAGFELCLQRERDVVDILSQSTNGTIDSFSCR